MSNKIPKPKYFSKTLIRELLKQEKLPAYTTLHQNDRKKFFLTPIGSVNGVELHLDIDRDSEAVMRLVDDPTLKIVVGPSFLWEYLNRKNFAKAVIAHELGHIESGHFENDVDEVIAGICLKDYTDEQALNEDIAEAILTGHCLKRELEADLQALNYVDPVDLIYVHLGDSHNHRRQSILANIEKRNRCVALSLVVPVANRIKKPLDFIINQEHLDRFERIYNSIDESTSSIGETK